MAKATTATKKSARANTFVTPVTPDYDDIASRLVDAFDGGVKASQSAQVEYERAITLARTSAIDGIRAVASEYPGMTEADFNEHIKAPITTLLEAADYKAIPTRVAMIKVAFLAFSNGIEPQSDKAQANLQHFVNDEARDALIESGIVAPSKKGRKSGSTSDKVKDERTLACLLLAGDAKLDKDAVKRRAAMLHWATSAGNWKLLEMKLNDMAKLAKKSFDA